MIVKSPLAERPFKVIILLIDFVILFAIFSVVFHLRMGQPLGDGAFNPLLWLFASMTLSCLYVFGSYDPSPENVWAIWGRTFLALLTSFALIILFIYLAAQQASGLLGRGVLIGSYGLFFISAASIRSLIWRWLKKQTNKLKFLLVTPYELVERFKQDLSKKPIWAQMFFYTEKGLMNSEQVSPIVESSDWLLLKKNIHQDWSTVIVASDSQLPEELLRTLMEVKMQGQNVMDLTTFYEKYWKKMPLYYLRDHWFLMAEGFQILRNPVGLRIKRLFDLFVSALALFITWPIMILTAAAIRIDSKGPAVFRQTRTGKDGRPFTIYKFRSMKVDAEKDGAQWAQKADSRITKVGKFIRLTRIDELPQLINVFRGDMSFIGPRPERPEFNTLLEKDLPYYNLRHLVRPGITGWAQILYPYGASVEDAIQKLQYELYYIKNYSLWMDLVITVKTISVVLMGRGR